jgi:hypothetical protein
MHSLCLLAPTMSAPLRASSRHLKPLTRAFSTSPTSRADGRARSEHLPAVASKRPPRATKLNLPPEKLRALISLYHNSETFITEQSLDSAIDHAFVTAHSDMTHNTSEYTMLDLVDGVRRRRQLPKFGSATAEARMNFATDSGLWSSSDTTKNVRDTRTSAALLGVDPSGRPGLEVVLEEEERIQNWITKASKDFEKEARKLVAKS